MDGGVLLVAVGLGVAILYFLGVNVDSIVRVAVCAIAALAVGVIGYFAREYLAQETNNPTLAADARSLIGLLGFLSLVWYGLRPRGNWRLLIILTMAMFVFGFATDHFETLLSALNVNETARRQISDWSHFVHAVATGLYGIAVVWLLGRQFFTYKRSTPQFPWRALIGCCVAVSLSAATYFAFGYRVLAVAVLVFALIPALWGPTRRSIIAAALNIILGCASYLALTPLPGEGPRLMALVAVWCIVYGVVHLSDAPVLAGKDDAVERSVG